MSKHETTRVRGSGYHVRVMVVLALLCQASLAQAQAVGASLTGQRVRVTTGQERKPRIGVLSEATPEMLTITTGGSVAPIKVPRADVVDLRVSRGVKRHTLQGLLAGAAAWGAIVGLEAAFDTLDESGVGEPLFIGGLLAAGAGIGSLIKHEHWERVPDSAVAVSIAPTKGGCGVRLRLQF